MSTQPERTALIAPVEWQTESKFQVGDEEPVYLPAWEHHPMVSDHGTYPARNPGRASKDPLVVPYEDPATGNWKPIAARLHLLRHEPRRLRRCRSR